MAIVTGSQKYGQPREDSDIDLVVLVCRDDLRILVEASGKTDAVREMREYPDEQISLRFGKLNLLCVTRIEDYEDWIEGTRTLVAAMPVSRERAVGVFEGLRRRTEARRTALEARQAVPVPSDDPEDLEF